MPFQPVILKKRSPFYFYNVPLKESQDVLALLIIIKPLIKQNHDFGH